MTKRMKRLLEVLKKNPGSDAVKLSTLGIPTQRGIIREAEVAGLIEWKDDGWYVK